MFRSLVRTSSALRVAARRTAVAPMVVARPAAAAVRAVRVVPAVRAMSTSATPAAAPAAVSKKHLSPEAQMATVKAELVNLLAQDKSDVGAAMPEDHPFSVYTKEHGIELKLDAAEERITLTKKIAGYDVKVMFGMSPDPDENEGADENGAENENENENEKEGENEENAEEEEDAGFNYSFVADVVPSEAQAPVFRVFAVSSKDHKLYFEGLTLASKTEDLSDLPKIDYNDLPTVTQDKIADFMDLLKIDDEFAQFVPAAAAEMSRLEHVGQLDKLSAFLGAK